MGKRWSNEDQVMENTSFAKTWLLSVGQSEVRMKFTSTMETGPKVCYCRSLPIVKGENFMKKFTYTFTTFHHFHNYSIILK